MSNMINTLKHARVQKGFIALLSVCMLLIFAIIGFAYWFSSRLTTDMIANEAFRIKARNFAQAAVEKVKIHIVNEYSRNNYDLNFSGSNYSSDSIGIRREYAREFSDGKYAVVSVKPYQEGIAKYFNAPHFRKGIKVGYYDIWEVVTEGEASGIKAIKTSYIKVYRDFINY